MENLWMGRENPVDILTAHIFLCRDPPMIVFPTRVGDALRDPFRLISCDACVKSLTRSTTGTPAPVTIHHFEETIAGRAFQIEVTLVNDRWRAQLRRLPGMPTAMMPFYGPTPEEAARQLAAWLTLAHRRQTSLAAN
ncbi:MAG TPA: hypothetical protein VGF24_35930 [Vicinamibacterales bacterium]